MIIRYLAAVLVTSLSLATEGAAAAQPPVHCGADLRSHYSARALRHMRLLLQMKLLQARKRRIRLASEILVRHGSPDALLALPDDAAVLAQGPHNARMKHLSPMDATTCW